MRNQVAELHKGVNECIDSLLQWLNSLRKLTNQNILTLRVEINAVLTDVSVLHTIISVTELIEQTDPQLR